MRRSFAIGWLALPPVWLGAVLLRPARFSCFGTATPEDETSAYLEKVVVELDAQEGLQETLSQIERLESDRAKISNDEAAVRSLVGQINQRQLHALIRMLTELESLELARRGAESAAAAAAADAGATSGAVRAIHLPPPEQLEALLGAEAILLESDSEIKGWIQRVMEDQVQTMVIDLQSTNNTPIIVKDSALPEKENCVQPEAAASHVQQAVVNNSHDGIGLIDYAQAGTIVHERTSPTYDPPLHPSQTLGSARWSRFLPQDWERFLPPGWQEWRGVNPLLVSHSWDGHLAAQEAAPPEAILDESTLPGSCWPMRGNSGRVTIRLPHPVKVTAVSIDHASSRLLDKDRMSSSPKKVNVYGYLTCPAASHELGFDLKRRVLLTSLEYDAQQGGVQTFPISPTAAAAPTEAGECGANAASIGNSDSPLVPGSCRGPPPSAGATDPMGGIEVEVHDNWGNAEYTCLYRFRVHGEAVISN